MIQKQRILEALENEVLSNTLLASNTLGNNNKILKEKNTPNIFHPFFKYSDDLWKQSESLQYLSQLDQETQISINVYYTTTLKYNNDMIDKYNKIADQKLTNCYDFSNLNETEKQICNKTYWSIINWESESAGDMSKNGFDVLNKFHPTKDRRNNFVLSVLMGNKSTKVLSGDN